MEALLSNYARMPFSQGIVPGPVLESVLAHVRGGAVLNTYDFADVVHAEARCGWQVKSTKAATPVTWKRAKIPNAPELIEESKKSNAGLQALGDAIIGFCNEHARASMRDYNLDAIGYARLIVQKGGEVRYFERVLCSQEHPNIFDPAQFTWSWSTRKSTAKKEQLPALHGFRKEIDCTISARRWWAWHGLGENQLHFTGESVWWPSSDYEYAFSFQMPSVDSKISYAQLVQLLQRLDA